MSEKPMTVNDLARMGGLARSKAHGKAEIAAWGRMGGRPRKLTKADTRKLRQWLEKDLPRADMAQGLNVSRATVTRHLARLKGKPTRKITGGSDARSV